VIDSEWKQISDSIEDDDETDDEESTEDDEAVDAASAAKEVHPPSFVLTNNQAYFKLLFGLLALDDQVAQMVRVSCCALR
jgi:hypothetical protein